jgi:hypothetical protein
MSIHLRLKFDIDVTDNMGLPVPLPKDKFLEYNKLLVDKNKELENWINIESEKMFGPYEHTFGG